jgi:hypothetical protein
MAAGLAQRTVQGAGEEAKQRLQVALRHASCALKPVSRPHRRISRLQRPLHLPLQRLKLHRSRPLRRSVLGRLLAGLSLQLCRVCHRLRKLRPESRGLGLRLPRCSRGCRVRGSQCL